MAGCWPQRRVLRIAAVCRLRFTLKSTGVVSKKVARHHQKPAVAAVHLHPSMPGTPPPLPLDPNRSIRFDSVPTNSSIHPSVLLSWQTTATTSMRGGRRGRRTGRGRLGSSTWTCIRALPLPRPHPALAPRRGPRPRPAASPLLRRPAMPLVGPRLGDPPASLRFQ